MGDDNADTIDHAEFEAQCRSGIEAWVAEHFDAEVVDMQRLERWRPQWKVTYKSAHETRSVLFRGNRPIAPVESLRFEMEVMQTLEANGIKVPHIYGWVDDPAAFVMDWIDSEDRAPGMLHTAIDDPTVMTDDRWQAMLEYMSHLADIHAVPISEFAHIDRLAKPPETPREIALHATERMYEMGKAFGDVDSMLEYLQAWLRRNVPEHRSEVSFIAGDAGQFMAAGTEVAGLLDFEIANLGDTHWDLACFRGRHPYENMGDIPALYRRYEDVTGKPVDLEVVGYYTVNFLQLAVIAATMFQIPEVRGANWLEGMLERASITRRALEAIAELRGVTLDYDLHLPRPTPDSFEASGLRKLIVDIERLPVSSAFETWERDLLGAIPEFLLNYSRYRNWYEQATIADIEQLTGGSYPDLTTADAAVMEVVEANDEASDDELVRVMHRRSLRLSMIVAGTDPDEANPFFYILEPILDHAPRSA